MDWAPHHVEVKYGIITNNQGMTISKSEVIVLIITSNRTVRNSLGDPRIKKYQTAPLQWKSLPLC